MRLWLDFETYSDLDIKKVGAYKYIYHPSFQVWCAGYAVDDEPVRLETELQKLLYGVSKSQHNLTIYAHNAEFEYNVLKRLGYDIPIKRFVCTMALAGTYGYPLQLDKFVKAIGLPYGKTAHSTRLINKLCKPQLKTIKNPSGRWYPDTAPDDFAQLYDYCKNDIKIMRDAVALLPRDHLSPLEQMVWGHTVMQNERGVRIDREGVRCIVKALRKDKLQNEQSLRKITGGLINTGKQVAKMKDFLHTRKCKIPNMQADTVTAWLNKSGLRHDCREVLKLRQKLAYSSVSKFEKMLHMAEDNHRVRGNLAYHAAHTGRWAGRGIQVHNLPRAAHDKPRDVLKVFKTEDFKVIKYWYKDISSAASKLVRPVIISDDKKKLIVGDYRSIENVVLHWAAGDEKTTQEFDKGVDQYQMYSALRLRKPYDEVTKEERNQSKPDVLGLGYGGGAKALIGVAAGYGVKLSGAEAQQRVNYYRKTYKKIPQFWRDVYKRARETCITGEFRLLLTPTVRLEFKMKRGNMHILLPSGRELFYKDIKINEIWYINVKGKQVAMTSEISYMGVRSSVWTRIGTHPGMLVENIVQALARDCLAYGLLCVEQRGYKVLMSVHDEIVCEMPDTDEYSVDIMCDVMCIKQDWAEGLPLYADGWEGYRYRKD